MNSQSLDTTGVAEEAPSPAPLKTSGKKSRRGRGSRQKAAERYREHKNNTKGMAFINDRISQFHLEFGYSTESLFGPMAASSTVQKPEQEVFVSTEAAYEVAAETVKTLVSACKVPTSNLEQDIETVQLATSLQIATKVHYAKRNSPYQQVDHDMEVLAERVVRHLDVAVLPVAVMIDQIGKVEVDGQKFYPSTYNITEDKAPTFAYDDLINHPDDVKGSENMPFLQRGYCTSDGQPAVGDFISCGVNGMHGGVMHMQILNRERAIELGYVVDNTPRPIQVLEPSVARYVELFPCSGMPSVDTIFRRYADFLTRAKKKVAYEKFPKLRLEFGVGMASQLVANGPYVNGFQTVWAPRNVHASEMFMSGAFRLGQYLDQPLYDEDVALMTSTVDVRNAIPRLMECLTQRVERK